MRNIYFILILVSFLSCSSSKILQEYKNPEIDYFQANKVLVIGLNNDVQLRSIFEKEVVNALEKENVRAVKSIDFFESSFTEKKKTMEELNAIEDKLLSAGFDAILLTKIIGKEKRFYTSRLYFEYMKGQQTFEDYYYGNQYVYMRKKGKKEDYVVYITETSLFCICPEKERELLWRGEIEIQKVNEVKKSINTYTKTLLKNFSDNGLLVNN